MLTITSKNNTKNMQLNLAKNKPLQSASRPRLPPIKNNMNVTSKTKNSNQTKGKGKICARI